MLSGRRSEIPSQWLPFVGRRLGLARALSVLPDDPEDLDLYHVVPTLSSIGPLLGDSRQLEPRAGGADVGLEGAVNRAMGELLERYAALAYDGTGKVVASYRDLCSGGHKVVPFDYLSLYTREQFQRPGFIFAKFTPDTPLGWFAGTDLTDGSLVYVPGQLISLGYRRAPDEPSTCFYSTSSGCALATSPEGALLGGLLECIERDAFVIRWYARLPPPVLPLDPATVLGRHLGAQRQGLELRLLDMTIDGSVPVVGATCIERTDRPCFFILGCAAALDVRTAARKALIEVGQGRPFVKSLAYQDKPAGEDTEFKDFDSNVGFFGDPSHAHYVEWFSQNSTISERDSSSRPDTNATPAELLRKLLGRCSSMGVTPIAFDLTTPEMSDHGLFASRVFVPELVPLCVSSAPFLGHPRLQQLITKSESDGSAINIPAWIPHPFP